MALSKTQLDKLGDRLRAAEGRPIAEDDLRLLDAYRRSFGVAAQQVRDAVAEVTGQSPTMRSAKTTMAIAEKLRRMGRVRLSQIQDIAGCRLIAMDTRQQAEWRNQLHARFPGAAEDDRLRSPSHGYRAIHLIVVLEGHQVEIQIRTELQHLWAMWSEKLADAHGQGLKYGQAEPALLSLLERMSRTVLDYEHGERLEADSGLRAPLLQQQDRQLLADTFQRLIQAATSTKAPP